jgi:hypothetical protein
MDVCSPAPPTPTHTHPLTQNPSHIPIHPPACKRIHTHTHTHTHTYTHTHQVRQPTCYLQPLPPSGSYAFRVVDIPVPVLNGGGGGGGGAEELVRLGRGACALGREAGEGFRVLHQTTGSDCDEDSEEVGAAFVDSDAELKLDGTDSESCSDGEVCGRGTLLAQQQQPLPRVALDAGAQRQEEVRRIAGTIRDH